MHLPADCNIFHTLRLHTTGRGLRCTYSLCFIVGACFKILHMKSAHTRGGGVCGACQLRTHATSTPQVGGHATHVLHSQHAHPRWGGYEGLVNILHMHHAHTNGGGNAAYVVRLSLLRMIFFFFFFILRRMVKNKALAHHTSTYFHTCRVSI